MSNTKHIRLDSAFESTNMSSTFKLTIDNIPQLRQLYPAGESITSDVIKDVSQFMHADVFVTYYPCGDGSSNADTNYASLFLWITPTNMTECFYTKGSFHIVDENTNGREDVMQFIHAVSQDSPLSSGRVKFVKLVDDDKKIRERLTAEIDIQIFTKRSYLRWLKLFPDEKIKTDPIMMYNNAIAFDNQDYDENDNSGSLIGVKGDDEITKLFSVSKEIVCNASEVFKTWFTDEKSDKRKIYELSGYSPELVKKFLRSIHTGILKYDDWNDLLFLLEISNKYQVIWIKNEVCLRIGNGLKIENGIGSLICADLSDAIELPEKCMRFCSKNFRGLKVIDIEEWSKFKNEHKPLYVELLKAATNVRPGLDIPDICII